jgi:hypothetical protein
VVKDGLLYDGYAKGYNYDVKEWNMFMVDRMLSKWIHEKWNAYVPPTRKGTPKGELIGFSERKYYAGLMMLKGYTLKQASEEACVSYGLIRKWNMQPEWKKMINQHRAEYIDHIIYMLKEVI